MSFTPQNHESGEVSQHLSIMDDHQLARTNQRRRDADTGPLE
jgi:hypothetical protein